jgi:hypothetical protein
MLSLQTLKENIRITHKRNQETTMTDHWPFLISYLKNTVLLSLALLYVGPFPNTSFYLN